MAPSGLTAVVINLTRRPDRLRAFRRRWRAAGEPVPLTVFPAADTGTDRGCLLSHLAILATHPGPVLILEDDAVFGPTFTLDLYPPPDWQMLWLGGQHRQPPIGVDRIWLRPRMLLRTHAYIAREPQRIFALAQGIPRADPHLAQLPVPQYVLRRQTVGQAAGRSDIDGIHRAHDEYWILPHLM